ncbi:PREDICTED: polynucleotide 5'-hydroxyl-kinase NOL9-like [Priapulus caudatus]|uniref:Polynucleotide 5'-hydroxyl-kinase NOL9-like n=1 Tax=Priapulus caudatus TaxID=37621 RepID=A0ABM1EC56_PRICU|nr:PREDICTED: polynucleotide 5'-hydroxyl-kinase NOL9-like [Priapulus caudatus]
MYADAPLPVCSFGGNWLSVIAETSRAINLTGTAQVFLVCGGRNVGKSTMARHLINSALSECKRVAYLECDIGQTEFTPSGCISLHIVTTPVIGPPFTHQRKPYRMCYYGHIAAQEDPVHYVACVKYVYQAYVKLRRDRVPLIVNTMGWNRGMGLNLLVDVINITQPTHVVQFVHSSPNKNLPLVNEEFLSCTPGMVYEQRALSNHRHLLVESYEEYHQRKKQYKPEDHRHLSFLAYMGKMLDFTVTGKSLPLEALQPYSLPWSAVGIHVSHAVIPNSLALLSLNASVVALCAADPKEMLSSEDETLPRFFHSTPVCKCFGFGIVRGIDPVQKVFYILTPVPFADLGKVNTLLKGVLEIPSCIMTTQKCQQPLPYVMEARHIPRVLGKESVKRSFKARPKYKRQGGARPSQRKRQP